MYIQIIIYKISIYIHTHINVYAHTKVYTLCPKNDPSFVCYNFDKCKQILLSGSNLAKKLSNQKMLYFLMSPKHYCYTTLQIRKPENYVLSLECCIFFATKHTKHIQVT